MKDIIEFRRRWWAHQPMADCPGISEKQENTLRRNGICTLGDVARCSLGGPEEFYSRRLLHLLLGEEAEVLIRLAWGLAPDQPVELPDPAGRQPFDRNAEKTYDDIIELQCRPADVV